MDFRKMFQAAAEETVAPLAVRVRKLEKQHVAVQECIRDAADDADRKGRALAAHKEATGEKLAKSSSAFGEWQGRLRRLSREHETACEALAVLERNVESRPDQELGRELRRAVVALAAAVRLDCERVMGEHIGAAVDERAAFLAAGQEFFEGLGVRWTGESADHELIYPQPQIYRPRNAAYLTAVGLAEDIAEKQRVPPSMRPPEAATPQQQRPTAAPRAAESEKAPGVAEVPQRAPEAT